MLLLLPAGCVWEGQTPTAHPAREVQQQHHRLWEIELDLLFCVKVSFVPEAGFVPWLKGGGKPRAGIFQTQPRHFLDSCCRQTRGASNCFGDNL